MALVERLVGVIAFQYSNDRDEFEMAEAIVAELGLEYEEVLAPEPVLDWNDDGSPAMCPYMVQPVQSSHLEWVDKGRWTTPWREVPGGRRDRYEPGDAFGSPTGVATGGR